MAAIDSNTVDQLSHALEKQFEIVETQIDAQLERLNKLDADDIEAIRRKRLEELKKIQNQKKEWTAAGHGEYSELSDEREFFNTCKRSEKIVCHFYSDAFFRCKIVDKHLALLAPKHLEAKFCKINAEKSPFLTKRLNIRVLPTIAIVVKGTTVDYIRGFEDLGGSDEFPTEALEKRLGQSTVINYSEEHPKPLQKKPAQRSITEKKVESDSDDSDF